MLSILVKHISAHKQYIKPLDMPENTRQGNSNSIDEDTDINQNNTKQKQQKKKSEAKNDMMDTFYRYLKLKT